MKGPIGAILAGVLILGSNVLTTSTAAPLPDRVFVGASILDHAVHVQLDHQQFGTEGSDSFEVGPLGNTNWVFGPRLFSSPFGAELGWDARSLRSRTEFNLTLETFNLGTNSFHADDPAITFSFRSLGFGSPHANHIYLAEINLLSPFLDGGATNVVNMSRLVGGAVRFPRLLVETGTNVVGGVRVFFGPIRPITSKTVTTGASSVTVNIEGQSGAAHTVSLYRRRADGTLRLFQRKTIRAPLPAVGQPLDSMVPLSVVFTGNVPLNRQVVRISSTR